MAKIRVLHVIARMNVGGTATYISNLIRSLEKIDVENLLAIGQVPQGEAEDEVVEDLPIVRVSDLSRAISATNDFVAWRDLKRISEDFNPDLIHSHTFKAGLLTRVGKKKLPNVHSFHGHHIYDPEFGWVRRSAIHAVERKLAKKSDAIITVGKKVMTELLSEGIGQQDQYVPIAPGIEEITLSDRKRVRERFGIGLEEKVVMWLGRFTKVKRPDRVIEIAKQFPGTSFVMAGGGDLMNDIWESAPSNVKLVGFQSKNDMWSIADIALCTSESEGMPLALIEAQMAGIPVVSTDVGSVSEIVVDQITGKLARRDGSDLVAALQWVLTELKHSADLGPKSRKMALGKFSAETMATAHFDVYKKVLAKVPR